MAKKNEFKPDRFRSDILGKLIFTKKERLSLLRWTLFSVVCLAGLIVQDVALYRLTLLEACADIAPCLIMMVAIMQGAESGSIFALVASSIFYFSGSAPGAYVIPLITIPAIFVAIFRQGSLRKGFFTILLCSAAGMLMYEMCVFGIGLFLGQTTADRLIQMLLSAALSLIVVPLVYPVLLAIGKIGGETWIE